MHQCYTQRLHSGCTHPPPSFQRDPALRPTAHALCEYRFFKQARDKAYIQKHLLQGGWGVGGGRREGRDKAFIQKHLLQGVWRGGRRGGRDKTYIQKHLLQGGWAGVRKAQSPE